MTNEFTAWCAQYYRLTTQFEKAFERYQNLLDDEPVYSRQHSTNEINDLMHYRRTSETARVKAAKLFEDLTKTAKIIVEILRTFGIPPRAFLIGEIPGEIAFELWTHESGGVVINKLKDLPKVPEDPNIITIKCVTSRYGEEEED